MNATTPLLPPLPSTSTHTLMVQIGTALPLSLLEAGISNDTVHHQTVMNNELGVMWKEVVRA